MALNFFKQRDIDSMDINDIPEEFKNYIDSLEEESKILKLTSRPDLAKVLGVELPSADSPASELSGMDLDTGSTEEANLYDYADEPSEIDDEQALIYRDEKETEPYDSNSKELDRSDHELAAIQKNLYEGKDLRSVLVNNAEPLEALAIPDKADRCFLHRTEFERIQINYTKGSTFGMVLRICPDCHRAFLEESFMRRADEVLLNRNVAHTFYDLELTNRYLLSQRKDYEFQPEEKVYVPDVWTEEKPTCPIHETALFEIPCTKTYKNRKVSFAGYICDRCGKILMRKAHALVLEDECAISGVPVIRYEILSKDQIKKRKCKKTPTRPEYIIEDGKRSAYTYTTIPEYIQLTEEDVVTVSDSIYCTLDGHDSEEILALMWITEKRKGRTAYLLQLGYCEHCQKYYMDLDDYQVVYKLGRPEISLIRDFDDDDYRITSGEVFQIERNHLNDLENDINLVIDEIRNGSGYVSPYATGDYDDGALSFAKGRSKFKYANRLEELEGYLPNPYLYRVDIASGEKTETYYVGAKDIGLDKNGNKQVISANSEFGQKLVNYQTTKIEKNGLEYGIKLSRVFEIDQGVLYGYVNLRTDDDLVFKSGITDPFLIRVLNMRKKQHNLIDIFATIQENQNQIVNMDFERNIIVQGCAGSGKTMVLLHRLSSLAYRQKYFDFSHKAMILTPNDQFNLHIKGLAEGLQIDNIERVSVEQYYIDMLVEYDPAFRPVTKVVSEMIVSQDYVNYIYSDCFRQDFESAYKNGITERNALIEILYSIADAMGKPCQPINLDYNPGVIQQMKIRLESMESLAEQQEQKVTEAKESLKKIAERKKFLETKLPEAEKNAVGIVEEALGRVKNKIAIYLAEKEVRINLLDEELKRYHAERDRIQSMRIMFGRQARLAKLDANINETEKKLTRERKNLDAELTILSEEQEGKEDVAVIAWMELVTKYIKDVDDEIRLCRTTKESVIHLSEELQNKDSELEEAEKNLRQAESAVYSKEIKQSIQYVKQQLEQYKVMPFYQMVFDEATAKFRKEHNVNHISGKCHRYDLYAMLIFAMNYYEKVNGQIEFLCVDEGQDLSFNEYRLIFELNQKRLTFNIFGDTNQLMKSGRGISDWSQLEKTFGAQKFILNENYRNTNQITRFCNQNFNMNVMQTGADGPIVQEIPRRRLEETLGSLNITTERVAILIPRAIQKKNYLKMDNIPSSIKNSIGETIGAGCISFMYVDEVKGIEFDKVFVAGDRMRRNEKYVAYTRALSELILIVEDAA